MTSSSVRYCFPAKCFVMFGKRHGGWSTSSQPQSCTAAIATTDLCAGALSWWDQYSLHQFSMPFWNVSSTTFQSSELFLHCGFIWKETMQLVSGKVEFNACQVPLLWHNFFLVSLWTSQPTLLYLESINLLGNNTSLSTLAWSTDTIHPMHVSLYSMQVVFSY